MRRVVAATVASLALLALVLATVVPELPDPIATHFGGDGTPDGYGPPTVAWAVGLAVPAVVAVLVMALTWSRRRPPAGLRWTAGLPVGLVWGVGGVVLATLWPQRGITDATTVTISPIAVVAALAVGVVATVAASRLATQDDPPATVAPAPDGATRLDLPAGSTALWQGETPAGASLAWLGVALAAGAVVAGLLVAWWLAGVLALVALLVVGSLRFRVTIGPRGVEVRGLVAGWPRLQVPLDTVREADTTTVRPLQYGGWGIRLQPGLATTAVVTTRGPALRLRRTDDSTVVVTLDAPEEAAAVVNALLDRRGLPTGPGHPTGTSR